jgi:NADH-quinone oxidoreductase subunit M
MLWAVKRVFFGEIAGVVKEHGHDEDLEIGTREMLVMAPLVLLIFWMGIFPSDFLHWSKASLDHLIDNRTHYELNVEE